MEPLSLSLRQRKILNYLQQKTTYTTGEELAGYLQVSSRTIRNDVIVINETLVSKGIRIISKRRWGYALEADDRNLLIKLNQSNNSFLSREDRIRYILFRLCLSDDPVNLYDLEDEMFISRTTLEHDLLFLRKTYFLAQPTQPYIKLSRHKNTIFLERTERKRRLLLTRLFVENWNYNKRGNTFYQYQYLDEETVDLIIKEINLVMSRYGIIMEDVNMVTLDLSVSIAYYRITSGYELTTEAPSHFRDPVSVQAADDLLDTLEKDLDCKFSPVERGDIYTLISCSRRLNPHKLKFSTVQDYFAPEVLELTDSYIAHIARKYLLDFSGDEDFYITILQFFRYLTLPVHNFNFPDTHPDLLHSQLLIEMEIAFSVQPFALEFYGYYLDDIELLYLAFCISGVLNHMNRTSDKIRTVIMCHLNLAASWNLKHKILSIYHDFIDLTALLPLYVKDNYDFSDTDLIISTAYKTIGNQNHTQTLVISPLLTSDDRTKIDLFIRKRQILKLYQPDLPSFRDLLRDANWHECIQEESFLPLMETLSRELQDQGCVDEHFLENILRRESILTFAFQPSVVLVYSLESSRKTQLSVATLNHRFKWNGYKIRTFILASIAPTQATLIFKLINELFYGAIEPEETRFFKTRSEWEQYLEKHSEDE